jgi:beta-glucosidase
VPQAGRDYNTVDIGRIKMLFSYKAAVDAGAGSVMAALMKLTEFST